MRFRGTIRATVALVCLTVSASAVRAICVGDCNDSDDVRVDELVTCVNIALDRTPLSQCLAIETNTDGEATINELITAVNNALRGCREVPTPTPDLGNQAPQVNAGEDVITAIDQPPTLTGSVTDDGMPSPPATVTVTWSKVSGPGNILFGSPNATTTSATFSAVGSYVLRLSADDSQRSGSDDVTVHVDIAAANLAPTLDGIETQTVTAGSALSLGLVGSDPNPFDELSYSLVAGPEGARVADGVFAFAPLAAQLGTHAVTVRVQDPDGLMAETSFDVIVVEGNRPPAFDPLPDVTTPLGVLFTQTLTATDPDAGDIVTFALLSAPPGLTLTGAQLSWTPAPDHFGTHIVSVAVSDGQGGNATGELRIVVPGPGAPTARNDRYEVILGQTLTVPAEGVLANDASVDGSPVTAQQMTQPDKGSVGAFNSDGSFTYSAPPALPTPPPLDVRSKWLIPANLGSSGGPAIVGDFDGNDGGKAEVIHFANNTCVTVIEDDGSVLLDSCPVLEAPDGSFCTLSYVSATAALADVDDDGTAEIVAPILCQSQPPAPAAGYSDRIAALSYAPDAPAKLTIEWISPTINDAVDVNGDAGSIGLTVGRLAAGEPPSVFFGIPFTNACQQVDPSKTDHFCRYVWILDGRDGSLVRRLYAAPEFQGDRYWGRGIGDYMAPIVADLEGDGSAEIIFQGTVWDASGVVELALDGADFRNYRDAAVGDLDGDGTGEIVYLDAWTDRAYGQLLAFRHDGRLLWRVGVPGSNFASKPALADLDRDGRPEILFTIWNTIYAVDARGSIRWLHELSIGWDYHTTLAVYDLNGDGVVEVIVQDGGSDVVFLDGRDGREQTRWKHPTDPPYYSQGYKKPLIADLDADGAAELVVRRDVFNSHFVIALQGDTAPWRAAPSRFPQFAYSGAGFGANERLDDGPPRWWTEAGANVFSQQAALAYPSEPRRRTQATFTYAARDGDIASEPATVTIDILPENRPPVVTSTPPTSANAFDYRGTPLAYQITAFDPDPGDTISFTLAYRGCGQPHTVRVSETGLFEYNEITAEGFPCLNVVELSDGNGGVTAHTINLFFTNESVPVPNLVGLNGNDVQAALAVGDLLVGRVTEAANGAPAGQVLGQNPSAGTSALRRSAVDIIVSTGPGPEDTDNDGDGFTENQGDCDDDDTAFNPGLAEIPDNGVDENCDGSERIVREIVVEPRSALRVTAERVAFTATAVYVDGTSGVITPNWASSQPNIASVDGTGVARALNIGSTSITATFGGAVGRARFDVADRAAGDQDPPTVVITTPADGGTVSGLTQITGTADDPTFLRFELAIAQAGETTFTSIGSGTTAVVDGVLGTLDPTLLLNEHYILRLTVFDSNENEAHTEVGFLVEGEQKVGNFTLRYEDLMLPVSGIPVQVVRTYDSRDKRPGDFGIGWHLDVQTFRASASRVLGGGWNVVKPGLGFVLVPGGDHVISVTLPSGKVESFELRITPNVSPFVPLTSVRASFVPRQGTLGTLESLDNNELLIVDAQPGPVTLLDDTTLDDYHPDRFRYTAPDGTQYVVRRTRGGESVRDPQANQITIGPGGIVHSAGPSVAFARDSLGRIISVTDPRGKVQSYAYSPAGDLISHTDATGNTTRFFYNANHDVIRIVDPLGRPVARAEYDTDGRITALTDAAGHRTSYAHDVVGRQEVVRDALGRVTVSEYDERGNVLAVTDPLGARTTFTYDERGNQLTTTDPLGATTTASFDAQNYVVAIADPLGQMTTFTRDSAGRPLTITNPRGGVTTNRYDAQGTLLETENPLGEVTALTHDGAGNLTSFTDAAGTTTNSFDGAGRRTQMTDALGMITTMQYDANGNLTGQQQSQPGADWTLAYDGANRVVGQTFEGLQRELTYDAAGQIAAATTATGQEVAVESDALGRIAAVTNPTRGTLLRQTYDAAGNRTSVADVLGNETRYTYDAADRLTTTTRPDGSTVQNEYDAAGRVVRRVDARGHATSFAYDLAGQLTAQTDPLGGIRRFEYDAGGNQVTDTDPAGRITRFSYDAVNRLTQTTFADGTTETRTYDAAGRLTTTTDPGGNQTRYTYDAAGHLLSVTDALGQITRYEYDGGNQRTAIVDANGNRTRLAYDAGGRLNQITYPGGDVTATTYDAAGYVRTRTNGAAETVEYQYNADGWLTATVLPGGTTETYTYTPDQRLESVTDARGTTRYAYHPQSRLLTRVTEPDDRYLRYAYDAAGNRTLMAHGGPAVSEAITRYTYDALNRVIEITNPAGGKTTQAYDAVGNLISIARPNGVTTALTYDPLNRVTAIIDRRGGSVLASEHYTLNALGHRTRIDRHDGSRVDYGYDPLGRVTLERHLDAAEVVTFALTYAYDPAGNRIASGPPAAPTTFTYNANNQLVSGGGATYTYDAAGRRLRAVRTVGTPEVVEYGWDARDRLISFRNAAGEITTYIYDSQGTRHGKDGADGAVNFVVDRDSTTGYSQILRQHGEGIDRSFVYGSRLLETVDSGTQRYRLFNHIGSTRFETGSDGMTTNALDYSAYGDVLGETAPSGLPHRFAGEELDPESGLTYLRARYYDPDTGAFLSRDPEPGNGGDPLSLHRYLYAAGNPVNRTDPSGRFTLPEVLVSSFNRLQAAGRNALNARRGLDKAKDVTAHTMRVLGGVLSIQAILDAMSNNHRVERWFGGGKLAQVYDLTELGEAATGAVEILAAVALGRSAIAMLNGQEIVFTIQGFGVVTSSGPDELAQATRNEGYSSNCASSVTARAFAVRPVRPGGAWGIHLCASFFGQTPMPTAENLTPQGRASMPGLMVHEFMHVISREKIGDGSYQCALDYKDVSGKLRQGVEGTALVLGKNLYIADAYRCWVEDAAINQPNKDNPNPWAP